MALTLVTVEGRGSFYLTEAQVDGLAQAAAAHAGKPLEDLAVSEAVLVLLNGAVEQSEPGVGWYTATLTAKGTMHVLRRFSASAQLAWLVFNDAGGYSMFQWSAIATAYHTITAIALEHEDVPLDAGEVVAP